MDEFEGYCPRCGRWLRFNVEGDTLNTDRLYIPCPGPVCSPGWKSARGVELRRIDPPVSPVLPAIDPAERGYEGPNP